VEEVAPEVAAADLEGVQTAATRLVSEPVVFSLGDLEYVIDTDALGSALVIDPDNSVALDAGRLEERIAAIERDVAVAPKNVTLAWDGGPYVLENDVPGQRLDREVLVERLQAAAASDARVEPLPMVEMKAPARADNIAELGLEALVASGGSSFSGSSYERAANVAVSAQNINYKLIGPGEEFSFNDLLGPITLDHGYIAGSIIQGDFAATDIGGGVCQVSTTVFRAAQNAGFQFSEWNPHSWRLAFYEADGSSPGLDAAIYQPNSEWEYELDLRFVNPLDSWLLLMMVVDGDWVSANFYGRDPGWSVEIFPARISDPKPLPEPVEKVNPNLAPGERRLVGHAQPGYTVWVRRKVTAADGTEISDGEFVSDYVSQPEAYEVGPS
jgi:vancomycin resistance protein YoaR